MARECKVVKERTCRECQATFFMTAAEIKAHAQLCRRAQMAGLILPGAVVRPKVELVGG